MKSALVGVIALIGKIGLARRGVAVCCQNKLATPIANFATKDSPLWVRDRVASIGNRVALVCMEYVVAPRAYWKGYLKLSLVSCPVALFPASCCSPRTTGHGQGLA